jgi:hypothetical protein
VRWRGHAAAAAAAAAAAKDEVPASRQQ